MEENAEVNEGGEAGSEKVDEKAEQLAVEQERLQVETANRAQIYGWVPKEEFRGDPSKWVPADVFVKRAEEILPIAKSMNRKLEGDLISTKKELEELRKTMKAVIKTHEKIAKTTFDDRISQIKKEQVKAVAEGDLTTWQALEEDRERLQGEKPEEIKFDDKSVETDTAVKAVTKWKQDNSWYESDPELGTYADSVSAFIHARSPGLTTEDFLEKVKAEVKKRFPEKFENPNRQRSSAVDRSSYGGNGGGGSGSKKTYSDLPADAKAACDTYVKDKILTREQYVKTYFEEA